MQDSKNPVFGINDMILKQLQFGRPAIAGSASDEELVLIDDNILGAIDLIELRIDHFEVLSEEHVSRVFRKAQQFEKPLIATIRSFDEGGKCEIDDYARMKLFQIAALHADLIDVEMRSLIFKDVQKLIKRSGKILIASCHDFNRTPDYSDLSSQVENSKRRGADIAKIAVTPNTQEDLKAMTLLTLNFSREGIVTICMGNMGLVTRVFFPIVGSLFSFASIGYPKAPGQISAIELRKLMDSLS
jgi:3-dehydroquinate dehydratase-1